MGRNHQEDMYRKNENLQKFGIGKRYVQENRNYSKIMKKLRSIALNQEFLGHKYIN